MGAFIAGPVIKFSIDENDLAAQVQAALASVSKQVVAQNKQISQSISQQIANPLIAQAAQLRALYSTGSLAIKDLQVQQKSLLGLLDSEISKLATRNDLTKQELSTLKALTLERERQQNALNRGVGVGVTSGTTSALSLVSSPIIANISRLSAGLLGVAGGSGAETTAFNAAASGIAAIAAGGGLAITVLGGLTVGLLAAAGAASALAISGGELVLRLSNISQRTGISVQDLQVLEAVAKTSNLGLEDIVVGFRKFSQALTGSDALDSGDGTGGVAGATKKASEILKILGVTSKDSFTAIEQVADAFQKLPDGVVKSYTAVQLFGRSGLNLIPILNKGRDGVEELRGMVETLGPKITDNAVKAQEDWKKATVALGLEFDNLKVKATPILNILTELEKLIGNGQIFSFLSTGILPPVVPVELLDKGAASAKIFGTSMADAFKIAETAGSGLEKKLKAEADGTAEALKKLREEGARELQLLNDEQNKKAQEQIDSFVNAGQLALPGSTPADDILVKQRQGMEALANDMLNFPAKASGVAAAVVGLTNTTITELQKLADEALSKANKEQDEDLAGEIKRQTDIANILKGVQDQVAVDRAAASKSATDRVIADAQKEYDSVAKQLAAQAAGYQSYVDLKVTLEEDAQLKIAKLRQDEIDKTNKEIQQQAGQLFDALVRGGSNFTTALKNSIQNLLLAPVKQVFEAVIGGILTQPIQTAKDELKQLGNFLKGPSNAPRGGILGAIGKNLSPPDSIGNNTVQVNLNTTATQDNTQALLNLNGVLTGTTPAKIPGATASSAGGGFGNILFGGAGAAGGLIFHGLPTSAQNNPQARGLFQNFGGLLLGGANIAGGIASHNVGQAIGGGVTLLGSGISALGGPITPGVALNGLQKVGGVLGGAGLVISGVSQGGLAGAASAGIGGAQIGLVFGGPVGAAIGAAAGFVAGLVGGLFGHKGPSQAQIASAIKRQSIDPNMFVGQEFDRSAQGTFGQTLNTTFSEGPGGTFSNAAINAPSPLVVHVSMPVNAIDSQDAQRFITQHSTKIARSVASEIAATQSGLARNIRSIVNPA